jgi:hypothetical protein
MAKETAYVEVLNLRIDEAMSLEIKRAAAQCERPGGETAKLLHSS